LLLPTLPIPPLSMAPVAARSVCGLGDPGGCSGLCNPQSPWL